jgi:translocation and assembly module TamA
MARPPAALALALSLGAAGCVRGHGSPQEPLVADLVLAGVSAVDRDELAAALATQAPVARPGVEGVLVSDRLPLDPDALATDRRRIEAFYRERGYYQARVEDVEVVPAGRGLVRVILRVSEGRPVRVSKLAIEGLDAAPEAGRRLAALPLRVGEVFTEGAYDAAKAAILGALLETGWATAEVAASAVVLPEEGAAEARFDVRPGVRYRFGPVFVAGSAAVSRERIRDEAARAIRTGAWWDESRLARAQAWVSDLGVFGGVRVARGSPDPQRGTIPVVVAVREAPFRTLRVGPGLAFEVARWDAQAQLDWQHRNFLGGLRRAAVEVRAGYAWVPSPLAARRGGTVGLVGAELRQPGLLGLRVDASARLEVERGIEDAYGFLAERLRLGLPVRLAPRLTLVPSWNLEVYQLSSAALGFVPGGTPGAEGPVLENCEGSVCLLSYLEQRVAWDGRDDAVVTRRGLYVALSVQEGFHVGGRGYQYLRLEPELRTFHPLGRRTVLAFRTRVGALVPLGETSAPPLVARFAAGGPLSMRGYYTGRLAPMVWQNGQWVPVGGNGVAEGSLELRFDLGGTLGATTFVDGAAVADASWRPTTYRTALDPTRLQWAAGVGLRYRTPFGPLRLDVAARLPERLDGPVDGWFPAVPYTAHREPVVAVHLALGEAF